MTGSVKRLMLAWVLLAMVLASAGCGSGGAATGVADQAMLAPQTAKPSSLQPAAQATDTLSPPAEPTPAPPATLVPTSLPTPLPTASPSATPTNIPEPVSPPTVAGVVAGLEGLPIDQFFDQSYRQLLLRDPEYLTSVSLSGAFGLRDDRLRDLSDAHIRETQELEAAILGLLRAYDRDTLAPQQQTSYDVYEWYLDNQVRGHQYMYHDYPLHHFIRSYHFDLDGLFNEIHPLDTRQNAEDYIARLSGVDEQVEQLLEGLKLREAEKIIPPDYIIDLARQDMIHYLQMRSPDPAAIDAQSLPVYTRFSRDIEDIDELNAGDRKALRQLALQAIRDTFVPAYLSLIEYLDYLQPLAAADAGVWKLPDGEAYYAYMLRQETSTGLSPTEIHELGLAEVERVKGEMRQVFAELGYPDTASLRESMDRAVNEAGYYSISTQQDKDRYIEAVEALVEGADQAVGELFDLRPQGEVVVIGGATGGYYVPGAPDGSRPGSYHVSLGGNWRPKYSMPTVAYHEAIPGHHFQIALAQEMDLPLFRTDVVFNAYAEGWAMYGERLAWELGMYDDDPYGNLGRLQYELLRAVRLVTDTGIHAMGWTREEAQVYMDEAMGAPPGRFSHEVDRYIVLPAQATGYKIGLIKILELRQRAMDQLGERFDIKEFHNVVLGNGSVPLDILERLVQDYIDARLASSSTVPSPTVDHYQQPGNYVDSISVDGVDRWFTIHLPPGYEPGVPVPLVLNLHPYTGTAFSQESLSRMQAKADQEGFVVVNPQALHDPPAWWGPLPGEDGKPDRDFFEQLVPYLQGRISIDPDRIYATGMSNGGTMSYRLGCEMSATLAAIAPVAGGHVAHPLCKPEAPISVLVVHGTEDWVIPYHGNDTDSPPVRAWLENWARHNGCDAAPTTSQPYESVILDLWSGCDGGTSVQLLTLEGGGHTWPGAPAGLISGGAFPFVDATDVIWEFFAAHPKSLSTSALTPTPAGPLGGGTGRIAFSSHREGVSQIYLVEADGSGLTRLTEDPNRVGHPVWSPNGTQLAYVLIEAGGSNLDIMAMDADGTAPVRLTDYDGVDSDPAWSPDGTRIAFTSNRDSSIILSGGRYSRMGIFEIYVLSLDGTETLRLTDNRDWDVAPAWSPDGQRIAFQSNRDGNAEIYVMGSDGSGQRNLTRHRADDASPAWSPDGTQIAFHSDRDAGGNFEIYVMNADGSGQRRLTHHPGWDINPAWSPDGQYLAFYRELNHNFEIYIMKADGSDQVRLTHDPGFDGFASWQP